MDNSPVLQAYNLMNENLIENRGITSCLPSSPLRTTFNPSGAVFNFPYPQQQQQTQQQQLGLDNASFESQLIHRLQSLTGYGQPTSYQYPYSQSLPYIPPGLYNPSPLLNPGYNLQPPPVKNIPQSPLLSRNSYAGSTAPGPNLGSSRNSEPRQVPSSQYQTIPSYHMNNAGSKLQQPSPYQYQNKQESSSTSNLAAPQQQQPSPNSQKQSIQHLQVLSNNRQRREASPNPQNSERRHSSFIKPLAQMGTLTTTDTDGRVRVIVPVPSNSHDEDRDVLSNLRIVDDLRPPNGPGITRSKSEKVPNRSQLMAEVQRTTWARHTTK